MVVKRKERTAPGGGKMGRVSRVSLPFELIGANC